jgi:hypothetical protein
VLQHHQSSKLFFMLTVICLWILGVIGSGLNALSKSRPTGHGYRSVLVCHPHIVAKLNSFMPLAQEQLVISRLPVDDRCDDT